MGLVHDPATTGMLEACVAVTLPDGSTAYVPAWTQVDQNGNFGLPIQATSTDRSGTITVGGTAQQLMPANSLRRGIWIQNQSTGDLYIYGLGAATLGQPSMQIPAGALYESPLTHVGVGVISIIGATTGQAFAAREW